MRGLFGAAFPLSLTSNLGSQPARRGPRLRHAESISRAPLISPCSRARGSAGQARLVASAPPPSECRTRRRGGSCPARRARGARGAAAVRSGVVGHRAACSGARSSETTASRLQEKRCLQHGRRFPWKTHRHDERSQCQRPDSEPHRDYGHRRLRQRLASHPLLCGAAREGIFSSCYNATRKRVSRPDRHAARFGSTDCRNQDARLCAASVARRAVVSKRPFRTDTAAPLPEARHE